MSLEEETRDTAKRKEKARWLWGGKLGCKLKSLVSGGAGPPRQVPRVVSR